MQPGFFGKVPTHGDFVSRRFPRRLREQWDGWLQHGLARSREQLGGDWLDTYLVSPVWHFALAEPVAAEGPVIGILIPSVDRVGRHFPLTLAAQLPAATDLATVLGGADAWLRALDAQARSALAPDFDLDRFDAALESPRFALTLPASGRERPDNAAEGSPPAAAEPDDSLASAFARHASGIVARLLAGHSLWWSEGLDEGPMLALQDGLPAPDAFAALLCGRAP